MHDLILILVQVQLIEVLQFGIKVHLAPWHAGGFEIEYKKSVAYG